MIHVRLINQDEPGRYGQNTNYDHELARLVWTPRPGVRSAQRADPTLNTLLDAHPASVLTAELKSIG